MPHSEAAGLPSPKRSSGFAPAGEPTGVLTVDLAALVANYRMLCGRARVECAAAVKADAYGLGVHGVAPALAAAGCRTFFVATLAEGIELRRLLTGAAIYVLNGLDGGADVALAHDLRPVINTLDEAVAWSAHRGRPAALHVDTGLNRLGMTDADLAALAADRRAMSALSLDLVMSHLACADEPRHPLNREQLERFRAAARLLAAAAGRPARMSLAASSGIFLGAEYCFDLVRPGAALYGLAPQADAPNPMAQVVRLQGRILQVRDVDRGTPVGYGATFRATRTMRLATVAVGYADGYLRSLGNRGNASIGGRRVPVVGRVSMDLITLDVADVPSTLVRPGLLVDLIDALNPADAVAALAGTNGYELLSRLGPRLSRRYLPADAGTT